MRIVVRILTGLAGVLGVLMALVLLADPVKPAGRLGLAAADALGVASLRADVGGFFGGVGLLSLAAATLGRARLLTAPVLLIALALTGRLVTVALNGYTPAMAQPIVIEAVLLVIFAAGRRFMGAGA